MADITALDAKNFQQLVLDATDKPILVDFWASWCGPCGMMSPVIDQIAHEQAGLHVYKCNVDDNQSIAMRYGIASIPTFMLFKNGEPVERIVGAMPKESLLSKITPHLS